MKCQFMQAADVKISMTLTVTFLANEMTSLPSGIHKQHLDLVWRSFLVNKRRAR